MTLAELQRALTTVEPAAVLVPPRVMEAIIRQVLHLSGMVWSVPHSQSWIVDRTLLFRHVELAELVLADDPGLPTLIALSWPSEEELLRTTEASIRLKTWRQLFHASIHQAIERCWEVATLTPARLREHIETIGPTEFEEIRKVLTQENILVPDAHEWMVFNEFAAVFLELFHFSPTLLPSFFPGLGDPQAIKKLLDQDVDSDAILKRTRLPGSLDPVVATESAASEAHAFFHDLEESSKQAFASGNMVQAAIELQTAVRVAPADQAPVTRKQAEVILSELVDRMKAALDLPDGECVGWNRLLPILLDKADQGSRPAEAGLLYDLQNICVDHEREMYKLDVVEYILSAGRRPIKRPLPSQRLVRITRTLRGAVPNLTAARLSDQDRLELESLLNKALQSSEDRLRSRFRPLITLAFRDVGLSAKNPLEMVAFNKMVEELLDRIIDSGFLTFSDLRDTISRNQLKLPDLTDPQDFIRGDPLIRLDRRLATVLDGVYRPGEFYLRWLERFTALNFGTKLGRLFTRYVTLPVGGGFLLLFAIIRVFHLRGKEQTIDFSLIGPIREPRQAASFIALDEWSRIADLGRLIGEFAPPTPAQFLDTLNLSLWFLFSAVIFGLIHSAAWREALSNVGRTTLKGLRATFVEFPLWIAKHEQLHRFLTSTPFQLFFWYVLKPAILTSLFFCVPQVRTWWGHAEHNDKVVWSAIAFVSVNIVFNSRPGEVIWGWTMRFAQNFFNLLHAGLIPRIIRFVELGYKQLLHTIEGGLFRVDEWLRFRGGESNLQVFVRSIATLVWLPISYLARFNLVVLIEPCFNPLKFPVVTVATKFYIPFVPIIQPALWSVFNPVLPHFLAEIVVWWIVFWLPDVFGFIFWEMKENWSLFRANRRQTVVPVQVGKHGETIRSLFQPGFHSGTLPKLFAKIRRAEAKALRTGNYSAVRQYRGTLIEIEASLLKFIDREFCVLLAQSPVWRGQALKANRVELSSNRIRFHLAHPNFPDQPLIASFENREGWIVAELNPAPWLATLSTEAKADLHNALVLLYKIAGVDLVCQQVRELLTSPNDHFDFTPQGLVIWDPHGKERLVTLRPTIELTEPVDSSISVLDWDPKRVLFSNRELRRAECLSCWSPQMGQTPELLFAGVTILPPPAAIEERNSSVNGPPMTGSVIDIDNSAPTPSIGEVPSAPRN